MLIPPIKMGPHTLVVLLVPDIPDLWPIHYLEECITPWSATDLKLTIAQIL